jgi:hypothetical protein
VSEIAPNSLTGCPAAWAERYESLRRSVLEGSPRLCTQPLGLALWLAKGMAGWMRQWSQWLNAATPPSPAALTFLLAQMTLHHLQPRRSL